RLTRADGQGTSGRNPVWEILWKLRVPSKVKIFVWKALHGFLSGLAVLANRHIPPTGQCLIYTKGAEDIKHLMFTCYRAKQVWRALGILDIVEEVTRIDRSGSIVLEEILRRSNNKSPVLGHVGLKELIVVGSWYI
uniref:Reverse transcriptase zinc-binding domain-containing protein n=1 Tax=Triticum urartu TaxID=4572 RepID=A0A8R7QFL0_TRIUA